MIIITLHAPPIFPALSIAISLNSVQKKPTCCHQCQTEKFKFNQMSFTTRPVKIQKLLSRSKVNVKCHQKLNTSRDTLTHVPTKLHQFTFSNFSYYADTQHTDTYGRKPINTIPCFTASLVRRAITVATHGHTTYAIYFLGLCAVGKLESQLQCQL